MTPKPESETDPWQGVTPITVVGFGAMYEVAEVDAARAAEATQHQMEIAAKDEQIQDLQSGRWRTYGNSCPRTFTDIPMTPEECSCVDCVEIRNARELALLREAISTTNAQIHQQAEMLAQRWDTIERLSARLAAVEAERDKAIDENIRLTNAEIEALRAERDRLKAAAQAVLDNGPCADPDCCTMAIKHEAALQTLRAALSGEGTSSAGSSSRRRGNTSITISPAPGLATRRRSSSARSSHERLPLTARATGRAPPRDRDARPQPGRPRAGPRRRAPGRADTLRKGSTA